jgi:hypothetical protein
MAVAKLELRLNSDLLAEFRDIAATLGSRYDAGSLAEDILESWIAERRLKACDRDFAKSVAQDEHEYGS